MSMLNTLKNLFSRATPQEEKEPKRFTLGASYLMFSSYRKTLDSIKTFVVDSGFKETYHRVYGNEMLINEHDETWYELGDIHFILDGILSGYAMPGSQYPSIFVLIHRGNIVEGPYKELFNRNFEFNLSTFDYGELFCAGIKKAVEEAMKEETK